MRGGGRPGQSQLSGDRRRTRRVQVAGEVSQQLAGPLQLEAKAPAQAQVVTERVAQAAHDSPPRGQGKASARSER